MINMCMWCEIVMICVVICISQVLLSYYNIYIYILSWRKVIIVIYIQYDATLDSNKINNTM